MGKREFGLIGYPLSHSFSKKYFADKFEKEDIEDAIYENYPLRQVDMLLALLDMNPDLVGLNVTIPYKEVVLQFMDDLAEDAAEIQAVNTIKRYPDGHLKGFNSDIYGFDETLTRFIPNTYAARALILGTGGASKAVKYVCCKRGIQTMSVSRKEKENSISYASLDQSILNEYRLIINTTPLGMHPSIEGKPDLPYKFLTDAHYLIDLIYNPLETQFLSEGKRQGCKTKNGMEMLILQAEKSWEIWNNPQC